MGLMQKMMMRRMMGNMMNKGFDGMSGEEMGNMMHEVMPGMMDSCFSKMTAEQREGMLKMCREMLDQVEAKYSAHSSV